MNTINNNIKTSNSISVSMSFNDGFKRNKPKITDNFQTYNASMEYDETISELNYKYDASIFDNYYNKNKSDYKKYWTNKIIDIGVGTFNSVTSVAGFFGLSLGITNFTVAIKEKLKGKSWSASIDAIFDSPGSIDNDYIAAKYFGAILGNYTWAQWAYKQFGSTKGLERTISSLKGTKSIFLSVFNSFKAQSFNKRGNDYLSYILSERASLEYNQAKEGIFEKGMGFESIKKFRKFKAEWMKALHGEFGTTPGIIVKQGTDHIPDEWLKSRTTLFKKLERRKIAFDKVEAESKFFSERAKTAFIDAGIMVASKIYVDIINGVEFADSMNDSRFRNYYVKQAILADVDNILFSAAGVIVFETFLPVGGYAVGVTAFTTLYDGMWKLCEYASGLERPVSEYDKIEFERSLIKAALNNTRSAEIYEKNKKLYNSGEISKADLDDSAIRFFVDDIGYGTPQALVMLAKQYTNGTIDTMPYQDGGRYNEFGVNQEWYEGKSGLDSVGFANHLLLNSGFGIDINSIDKNYMIDIETAIEEYNDTFGKIDYTSTEDSQVLSTSLNDTFTRLKESKKIGCMLCKKSQDGEITDVGFIVGISEEYVYVQTFTSNVVEIKSYNSDSFMTEVVNDYNTMIDMDIYDVMENQNYSRPDVQEVLDEIKKEYNIQFYSRTYAIEQYMKNLYDSNMVTFNAYQNVELQLSADKIAGVNSGGEPQGGYATGIAVSNVANYFFNNKDIIKIKYSNSGGYTNFGIPENGFEGNSFEFAKWSYQNGGVKFDLDKLPKSEKLPKKSHKYTCGDILYKDLDGDGKYSDGDLYLVCTGGTKFVGLDPRTENVETIEFNIYDKNDYESYASEYEYINMRAYIDKEENKDYTRSDMALYSVKGSKEAKKFYDNSKILYEKGQIPEYIYRNASVNYQVNKAGYAKAEGMSALINYTTSNSDEFNIPYSSEGRYIKFGVDSTWYDSDSDKKSGLSSFGYIEWIIFNSGYKIDENTLSQQHSVSVDDSFIGPYNDRIEINDKFYIDDNGDGKFSDDECWIVTSANDEVFFQNVKTKESFAIPTIDKDYPTTTGGIYHFEAPKSYEDFIKKLGNGNAVKHETKDYFGSSFGGKDITVGDIFYNDTDGDGKISEKDECAIVESNDTENKIIIVSKHGIDKDGNSYTIPIKCDYSKIHDWQGCAKEIGMENYIQMGSYYNNSENKNDYTNNEYINQRYDLANAVIISQ